jgi:hypothetical protein
MPNPFQRLRKMPALASLPYLDGKRRRRLEPLPLLPSGGMTQVDVTPDEEQELARVLKDEKLARRVVSLQQEHPYGTVPEMLLLDFLQQKGERYKYQAQLFGGFRSGGLVPDFVVSRGGSSRAILVNGSYWHNVPGKREKDASDKLRLLNSYYEGELITSAVIVWESRLMAPSRDVTMEAALAGVEMGQ